MTRKRFVKLLMAEGYSRNEANNLARKAFYPYAVYRLFTLRKCSTSSLVYPRRNYKLNLRNWSTTEE